MKRHRRNSGKSPRARSIAAGLLYSLLAAFLVACSSLSERPGFDSLADGDGPAYLLTVELADGDTRDEILSRHGGEIVTWVDDEFAVLGLGADEVSQGGGEFSLQSANADVDRNLQFVIAPNVLSMQGTSGLWAGGTSSLWAGGTSRIWAGGTSYLWAGGTSYLWAGGEYQWMPENTGLWQQIRLEEAHGAVWESLGEGVRVAVIDTAIDLVHPALSEALVQGIDFVDNDLDPQEEGTEADAGFGHGTSVAGIVRQVAPRATIIPIRILDNDGTGDAADLARAIVWAVTVGHADVINLSLGGAREVRAVEMALAYAARNGVFVVASTGDSGNSFVTYPASGAHEGRKAPYLLSLTSVDQHDVKSDFAPYHEDVVELAAPGEYVYGPAPGLRAAAWSGTSMSAPMASGALALALGAERAGVKLQVSQSVLAETLMASSEGIDDLNPQYVGQLGEGRLDIAAFLGTVLHGSDGTPPPPVDHGEESENDRWGSPGGSGASGDQGWRGRPAVLPEAAPQRGARGNRGN